MEVNNRLDALKLENNSELFKLIIITCTAAMIICGGFAHSFASEKDLESKTSSPQTEVKRPRGMADGAIEQVTDMDEKKYNINAACLYIDIVAAFSTPAIDDNFLKKNKIILQNIISKNIYKYKYIKNGINIDFYYIKK